MVLEAPATGTGVPTLHGPPRSPGYTDRSPTGQRDQNNSHSTEPLWGLQTPFAGGGPLGLCHRPGKRPPCCKHPRLRSKPRQVKAVSWPRSHSWEVQGHPRSMTDLHPELPGRRRGAFLSHVSPLSASVQLVPGSPSRPSGLIRIHRPPGEPLDHADPVGYLVPKKQKHKEISFVSKNTSHPLKIRLGSRNIKPESTQKDDPGKA